MSKEIQLEFEEIDIDGSSISYHNSRLIKCFGVLPTEKAIVKPIKKQRNFIECIPLEIISKSAYRVDYIEDHFLSCSPWQIAKYEYQIDMKRSILRKIFGFDIELLPCSKITGYRTKMEYCIYLDGIAYLGLYRRGTHKAKWKLEKGCVLAPSNLNSFALDIISRMNDLSNYTKLSSIKGIAVRQSYSSMQSINLICSIFVSEYIDPSSLRILYQNLQDLVDFDKGIFLFYSNPKTPAYTFDECLFHMGLDRLEQKIHELKIVYGPKCFFQNNVEMFEKVILDMMEFVNGQSLVDLYCGVGVIGLALSKKAEKVLGVEIVQEAAEFAKLNSQINQIHNFNIVNIPVENIDESYLKPIVVVDPPRNGLHPRVIKALLKYKPERIIYLSCNPVTQARDYKILKDYYDLEFFRGYDFYPNTPHVESLLVLKGN
ncbi:MAG: methyltransferase [bacterium]